MIDFAIRFGNSMQNQLLVLGLQDDHQLLVLGLQNDEVTLGQADGELRDAFVESRERRKIFCKHHGAGFLWSGHGGKVPSDPACEEKGSRLHACNSCQNVYHAPNLGLPDLAAGERKPMSYDGEQRIVLVRSADDDALQERVRAVLKWRAGRVGARAVVLGWIFGFGETQPIGFRELDRVVDLGWSDRKLIGTETEIRILGEAEARSARAILDELKKKPIALAKKIAESTEEDRVDHADVLEVLRGDPNPKELDLEDARTSSMRVAHFFMQLRRITRFADKAGESVAVAVRVRG